MLSIHGKVLGLAMVMAALGTGCAIDAADADLDEATLGEGEQVDSTTAALEEGVEEARGGFQAPGKEPLLPPAKGGKGSLGAQAPLGVGQQLPTDLGQAPVGAQGPLLPGGQAPIDQVGQAPIGQVGQAPIAQVGQAPIGQVGQAPIGQVGQGPVGVPGVGGVPGVAGVPGLGGFGVPGLAGFGAVGLGSRFFGFGCSPVTINNNNNINIITLIDEHGFVHHVPHHCCPHHGVHDLWPGNSFNDFERSAFERYAAMNAPRASSNFAPCSPRSCCGGPSAFGWPGF
ncbi:hypothetical protein [Sorangium sp. So ce1389]|uniref:hypothetical protein n=1 Tax=Sorangium sp. So ce1389 TaxID=3133336 RepID=UPI003F5EF093